MTDCIPDERGPSLTRLITELAAPLAESLNLSIWGVELAFGKRMVVRLYVEGPDGVTIDQCAELSRLLSLTLDVEDSIPNAYVLEVSSPGLERIFFTPIQLASARGQTVDVVLHAPSPAFAGRRKFRGRLCRVPQALCDSGSTPSAPTKTPLQEVLPPDPQSSLCSDPEVSSDLEGGFPLNADAFCLEVDNPARPGEVEGELAFTFPDLKKARLVHVVAEKVLPGKGKAGGKNARKGKADKPSDTASKTVPGELSGAANAQNPAALSEEDAQNSSPPSLAAGAAGDTGPDR